MGSTDPSLLLSQAELQRNIGVGMPGSSNAVVGGIDPTSGYPKKRKEGSKLSSSINLLPYDVTTTSSDEDSGDDTDTSELEFFDAVEGVTDFKGSSDVSRTRKLPTSEINDTTRAGDHCTRTVVAVVNEHLKEGKTQNFETEEGKAPLDAITSAFAASVAATFVMAAVEVDELRRAHQSSRRTLYAFTVRPDLFVEGDSTIFGTEMQELQNPFPPPVIFRTYKEWTAEFPIVDPPVRPPHFGRLTDIGQRLFELDYSYKHLHQIGKISRTMNAVILFTLCLFKLSTTGACVKSWLNSLSLGITQPLS